MKGAVERRTAGSPRIPLDVLVELAHAHADAVEDGCDAFFEADGVNLGLGGLSMRSSVLPDVGTRLLCRFRCSPDDTPVEADGEVVWAQHRGAHAAEFGLRFTDVPPDTQRALEAAVASSPGDASESVAPAPDPERDESARVHLDGVSSPIVARVVERRGEGIIMEQELPFLRLKTGVTVDAEGRRGRIRAVDVAFDGDVPRLVLDVVYEGDAADLPPTAPPPAPLPSPIAADDATWPDEEPPAFEETPVDDFAERTATLPGAQSAAAPEAPDDPALWAGAETAVEAPPQRQSPSDPVPPTDHAEQLAGAPPEDRAAVWSSQIRLAGQRFGAICLPWIARAASASREAWAQVRHFGRRIWAWIVQAKGTWAIRWPALRSKGRRRRTAPAPLVTNVSSRGSRSRAPGERTPSAPASRTRTLAVSALAAFVVGFAVYAWSPSKSEPPPVPKKRVATDKPKPLAQQPLPVSTVRTDAVAASRPKPAPTPSVAVPSPAALAPPSREAGPIPAPTFPTLRTADTDAPSSPSPEAPRASLVFGAERVPGGRSYLLRMSRPVDRIEGRRTGDGFTVNIPGSLSLDRAAPIAASHSAVERSMVLNRGDHAELTLKFVEGKQPKYRVLARGAAIEIILGK